MRRKTDRKTRIKACMTNINIRGSLAWLRHTAVLTLFLTAIFLTQQYLILPLEIWFSESSLAAIASLVFIPHGAKVLLATLSGYGSIVPILTAQFIGGLSFNLPPGDAKAN